MTLKLYNQGAVVGHMVISKGAGMAGFNSADPGWQLIAIPVVFLALVSNTIDKIRFALANSWPNGIILSIDKIRIQHDLSQIAVDVLKSGIYGSATKNLILTVDEVGKITKIEEVDNGIGDIEIDIDFQVLEDFVYVCPIAMKFIEQISEGTAATLSTALNTDMAQFVHLTITPTALGMVILKGITL